jgi:hypothetical protein
MFISLAPSLRADALETRAETLSNHTLNKVSTRSLSPLCIFRHGRSFPPGRWLFLRVRLFFSLISSRSFIGGFIRVSLSPSNPSCSPSPINLPMVWYGRVGTGREVKGKGEGSTIFRSLDSTGSRKDLNVHLETFIVYNLHIFFSLLPYFVFLLFSFLFHFSFFLLILAFYYYDHDNPFSWLRR